jgi:tetratricopeptide (TPR) repeat protein
MAKTKTKKFGVGVVALMALTAIGAGLSDTIKEATKSTVNFVTTKVRNQFERVFPPTLPQADKNAVLSILVARLAGDDGSGSQTERVRISLPHAFGKNVGIQFLETDRQLKRGVSGDDLRDRATAESEGRRWLKDNGSDILVWGEIAAKDKVYRLRFIQNAARANEPLRVSYLLNDSLELAKDFQDDVALVAATQVTSLAAPIFSKKKNLLDPLLDDLYMRLAAMHRRADQASEARTRCQVSARLAAVAQTIGDLRSDVGKLTEAVEIYRTALTACAQDREFVPSTKNDLGYALHTLARATMDAARFEEAVAIYSEALQGFSRERAPQEWARTQTNLGIALQLLGTMKSDASLLENSIKAQRAALEIVTRERSPFDWALVQSNLGTTLQVLGLVGGDLLRWNEAIQAFSLALEELTEEEAPIQSATIRYYLAVMLYHVGLRLPDTPHLASSISMFQSAIKILDAANDPPKAQIARTSLSIAEQALAERRAKTN